MYTKMPNTFMPFPMFVPMPTRCLEETIPQPDESYFDSKEPTFPSKKETLDLPKDENRQLTPVTEGTAYTQGWLASKIGSYIKVEFLLGTSMLIDREGFLTEVGISYIVLKESGSNDLLMCDIYSIKFVRLFDNQEKAKLCK